MNDETERQRTTKRTASFHGFCESTSSGVFFLSLSRAFCESTFIRLLFVGLASRPRRFLLLLRVWRVNVLFWFCFRGIDESATVVFFLISWVWRVSLCDFFLSLAITEQPSTQDGPVHLNSPKGCGYAESGDWSLFSSFVLFHNDVCSAPLCSLTKKSAQHLCVVS